jgi:hypothetical protein
VVFLTEGVGLIDQASPGASEWRRFRGAAHTRRKMMTGADKLICRAAALLVLLTLMVVPAKAQFSGFGSGGGGSQEDIMTQMAPMLEMMKAKMGKKRFGAMMQTMGPMMSQMMQGGSGGFDGGGIAGGFGGGFSPDGFGGGSGFNMGDMMGMIGPMMQMANFSGGGHRHHHRHK